MNIKLIILSLYITVFQTLSIRAQLKEGGYLQYGSLSVKDTSVIYKEIQRIEQILPLYPDSAIQLLEEVYRNSKVNHYDFASGAARLYQGNAFLKKSDYINALRAYQQACYYLYKTPRGRRNVPAILNNIGNVYQQMNNYEKAVDYFYKAIFLADSLKPSINVDYIYHNLAGVLIELDQPHTKVLSYLHTAEKFAQKKNDFSILTKNNITKGYAYFNARLWDSSLIFFNKAYKMAIRHNYQEDQYVALLNIACVYSELYQYDTAIHHFLQAEQIQAEIAPFFRNRLYKCLGVAYARTGRYRYAEQYLTMALQGSQASNQLGILLYVHKDLSDLYSEMKQFEKAYYHNTLYSELKDSVAKKEIINRVNSLESKYSVAKKNEEIARKELEIQSQHNRIRDKNILLGIIILCTTGLIIFLVFRYRQKRKLHRTQMEGMKKQQHIELLQAHINGEEQERKRIARELHDGLGGLSSALSLNIHLLKEEPFPIQHSKVYANVEHILASLHSEIKKTAHNLTPDILIQHSLQESILLSCKQMADAAQIDLIVQSIGSFETLDFPLKLTIYRIIQELVNNIVKHARATKVLVQLVAQPNATIITVEDNGIGYNTAALHKGMGLENIKSRVSSLDGLLNIESAPGEGTTTTIEFYN